MAFRYILLSAIGVAVALGCFRLSKWQVDRLEQRRQYNALLAERVSAAPVPLSEIPNDTASAQYRRTYLRGVFDYEHELALALRARDGSPGVYILTPLRLPDGRTLLTNRGWVYAPDGMTIDFARWRERGSVEANGFLDSFVSARGPVTMEGRPQLLRQLVRDSLLLRLGEGTQLLPYVFVLTTPAPASETTPARLSPPAITAGPHLSYAIQWAVFGIISLVGTFLALRRGIAERRSNAVAPSAVAG
ncbi:MAG TPA: SURF1 family protein [Gemmatimonadaceae bacterium]|jgi:surfeit locus 1 family protein